MSITFQPDDPETLSSLFAFHRKDLKGRSAHDEKRFSPRWFPYGTTAIIEERSGHLHRHSAYFVWQGRDPVELFLRRAMSGRGRRGQNAVMPLLERAFGVTGLVPGVETVDFYGASQRLRKSLSRL